MQQFSPPTFQIRFQLASSCPHGFPGPSVSMQVAAVRKRPAIAQSPASDEDDNEESDAGWKMFKRATPTSDEAIEGEESELEEVCMRDEPEEEEEEDEDEKPSPMKPAAAVV